MDEETGLYYYGARYYNPRESIFLSVDPLAENYPSVSSYAYALQNPVRFIDPDGRAPIDPPTWAANIMKTISPTFYEALYNANNTSPNQFYEWANGRSKGWNNVIGAAGESVAGQVIRDAWSEVPGIVWFGQSWNGKQVDLQYKFATLTGKSKVEVTAMYSSFNGKSYQVKYDSTLPVIWTLNYEVKTIGSVSNSAKQIYSLLEGGFKQAYDRTSYALSASGVLVTDYDAWMKVVNDETYGPKLKALYNHYVNEKDDDGVKLFLIKNLTSSAVKETFKVRSAVQDKK